MQNREFWAHVAMSVVITISVGTACYFIGSNQGLRQQDSKVILELRQKNQNLVTVVNFSIKQDTTGSVLKIVKEVGLLK